MNMVDIIRKKRSGQALSPEEVRLFVDGYTRGLVPDYQAAALLMAIFHHGLDEAELSALTSAMIASGEVIDLSDLPGPFVDKHSTGGVGDKISIPLAPAVAACGVGVPMISGRGLGHSGGTLDKLESIPGFRTDLPVPAFKDVLARCGLCLVGQTERLVPADKKLYALRDVTGTVESVPLIAASIMSKKLAEGAGGLVLDVKVGSGAFMKDLAGARLLARTLLQIGRRAGQRVSALITDMDQPLGRMIGNAAEIDESLMLLRGKGELDVYALVLALGGEMLRLAGVVESAAAGERRIAEAIASGAALRKLAECALLQGAQIDLGDEAQCVRWMGSNLHPVAEPVVATRPGFVTAIDAEAIGRAGVALHAGRRRKEDAIDPAAYIYLDKKRGDAVMAGEPLCRFAGSPELPREDAGEARGLLAGAYLIGDAPPAPVPLIIEALRETVRPQRDRL